MTDRLERFEGCLLGLACGDAVGAPVESLPRGGFPPVTDMASGEWTDDTAMALCLAESLIECQGFDALDQMHRYLRWLDEGHNASRPYAFGIGRTVAASLARFRQTGEPYSGSPDPEASGNGSLMRLAPVPMYYACESGAAVKYAALSSRTTHGSADCIACGQYLALVLVRALAGEPDKSQLFPVRVRFDMPASMEHIVRQDFRQLPKSEINGSGFVVESLEAALWCFWHTKNFKDAILTAANLGDDSDTTAAICGQLAGAFYGSRQIPHTWVARLYRSDDIRRIARQLAFVSKAR